MVVLWRLGVQSRREQQEEERQAERTRLLRKPLEELVEGLPEFRGIVPLLVCDFEFMDSEAEDSLEERDWLTVRRMTIGAFSAAKARGDVASEFVDNDEQRKRINSEEVAKILEARREKIAAFIDELSGVRARRRYARGFYLGVGASILVLVLVGLVMKDLVITLRSPLNGGKQLNPKEFFAYRDSLACLGGGSLGASISVLLRLGAEHRVPHRTTSKRTALYRITLGWLFAAGILCMVKGHIVAVFPDPTETLLKSDDPFNNAAVAQSFFFWVGIGILAGFNERWVKRLISQPISDKDKGA
ncbi:hypothetical protein [Streptomyces sp. NPDC050564]|uniref:hypothetical protein n=1 Tax=Streptomyces sp. NPDC050564 TaxID=3365631 RepID=UPI0037BC7C76